MNWRNNIKGKKRKKHYNGNIWSINDKPTNAHQSYPLTPLALNLSQVKNLILRITHVDLYMSDCGDCNGNYCNCAAN